MSFGGRRKERCERGDSPRYSPGRASCACGATWKTRSTERAAPEICSNCHPFFTGRQLIDTEGRVERFTKKFGAQTSESRKKAAAAKAKKDTVAARKQRSLKAQTSRALRVER
jgi:large subunit ribosomal protein L31